MNHSSTRVRPGTARTLGDLGASLTARQVFVLRGIVAGHTNQQMAAELCLTEYTIKYHCRALYQHFNVANRMELVSQLLHRFGNDLVQFARNGEAESTSAQRCSVSERRPAAYVRGPEVRRFVAHEQFRQQRL